MTILPSNIGSNKSPTVELLTMRNVSHPHPFQHCLYIYFILSLSPEQSTWLHFLQNACLPHSFPQLCIAPNKPNQQEKLFFLIKGPHFSWDKMKQTINLSLFVLRKSNILYVYNSQVPVAASRQQLGLS